MILAKVNTQDNLSKYLELRNGLLRINVSQSQNFFGTYYNVSDVLDNHKNVNNLEFVSKYKSDIIIIPTHIFNEYIIKITEDDIFYDNVDKYIQTFIHKNLKIIED